MNKNKNASRKLIINIITITFLVLCLCITTYAATRKSALAKEFFQTGEVKININDGLPVIDGDGLLFEPGMTVEKSFFVKNEGTCDVYFKVYFQNANGRLANVLNIKVLDGDSVLFDGTPQKFNEFNAAMGTNALKPNERKDLTMLVCYPETSDNSGQGCDLTFDLCAKAVQAKNNTNKDFN